jgi:hypothetical protein
MKMILSTDYRIMETVTFYYDTTIVENDETFICEVHLSINMAKQVACRLVTGDYESADFNAVETIITATESLKGRTYVPGSIKNMDIFLN